jgi:large subunit ribosomal protein L32
MAVPKQKHTKSRRDKRRLNIFLKAASLIKCPKCGQPILAHTVCPNCGYYKGREVIDVLKKLTKKERKKREREMKEKEKATGKESKEKPLTWEEMSRK